MEENRYKWAGVLAVLQAVLFPVGMSIGIIEAVVAKELFNERRPFIGPSDLIMIVFTIIGVYTMLMFRRLLHERYDYHELDLLIIISIWWAIAFQAIGLVLSAILMISWPVDIVVMAVTYAVFFTGAMVTIGIVDIMIATRLLKGTVVFSDHIRYLAYITMAAGICEVTVLLAPFSLILIPVSSIVLAMVFFRDRQEVEFV